MMMMMMMEDKMFTFLILRAKC